MAKITWKSKVDADREKMAQENFRIEAEQKKAEIEEAPARVAVLEEENMMLMMASAEMYEQMSEENMNLMLAVAEVYEMMIEGGTV